MDIFGDDDDEIDEISQGNISSKLNEAYICLMKIKPFVKVSNTSNQSSKTISATHSHETILYRSILLISPLSNVDDNENNPYDYFVSSIKRAKFDLNTSSSIEAQFSEKYDIVVDIMHDLGTNNSNYWNYVEKCLGKDGIWIGPSCTHVDEMFDKRRWQCISDGNSTISTIRRRAVAVNDRGCIYWTGHERYDLDREYRNVDKVIVRLTEAERNARVFSDSAHQNALKCLDEYGICIFPGLFDISTVNMWGDAIRGDMNDALNALLARGIDLMHPGPMIDNYYELSMREALRVDLRNGNQVKNLSADCPSMNDIRHHPAIRCLMAEAMNPSDGEYSRGNWGLWNFEGAGPNIPRDQRPVTIGHVGGVISFPGCADQTIHADTSHIYTPSQLPGHYFNLFLPASTSDDLALGQTAFVLSSHRLDIAAKTMVDTGGQELLESLLIRPQLQVGDSLIFDCRILHFGLANQSVELNPQPRVMIYINHHQPWFHDPKNWNDRERLFPVNK